MTHNITGQQSIMTNIAKLTEGPQSLAQPSLMGISTTATLGASTKAALASSADCRISKKPLAPLCSGDALAEHTRLFLSLQELDGLACYDMNKDVLLPAI